MPVYKIDNIALQKKGSYADKQPLQGNNYYRLKAINPDGSTQYSKVTLLNRKAAFAVNVFPNPAMTTISLDIRDENPGRFTAILRNAIGQTVIEKSFFVNSGAHMEKLQVSQQARGIYHLTILRENKQVTSTTIQLK